MPKKKLNLTATVTVEQKKVNKDEFLGFLERNGKYQVDCGITKEVDAPKLDYDRQSQDISLVEVALIHEFGTEIIPQRSFLRAPFNENKGYEKLHLSLLNRAAKGIVSINSLMKILGSSVIKSLRKNIKDVILPLNDAQTIKRKGESTESDIPLIATGQLIESLTFRTKKE